MKIEYLFLFVIFLCFSVRAELIKLNSSFIAAEIQVESGGNDLAIGDHGKALGCLQIHKECWQDAVQYDKSIGGKYADCTNRIYSIKIITSYLNKYGRKYIKSNDYFSLARIWNGGAGGLTNSKTISYGNKVIKRMK